MPAEVATWACRLDAPSMDTDETIQRAGQLIAEALALLLTSNPEPPPAPKPVGWVVGDSERVYLDTAELADRLRVSESTLRDWRQIGDGPLGVKFGKRVLYPVDELERWEASERAAAVVEHRRRGSGYLVGRTP